MTYNYNRSSEEREKRFSELSQKQVDKDAAKYVVVTTRDAADGCFDCHNPTGNDHYFDSLRTARAWAQHYSDTCDHVCGIFQAPKFIEGVDVR